MNKYLSNKLTFFSFWMIVLVVLLHSLNVDFTICDNFICSFQYLLSHKLAQIAVPLFFFISGYLYFLKKDIDKKNDYFFFITAIKKRFKTIMLPFVLWCVFWFLFMYFLQQLPVIKEYFSEPIHLMAFQDKILNLFFYPLNYPFWFLRELMVLIILTPLLFLGIKYLKIIFVFLLFALAIFFGNIMAKYDFRILGSIPLLFFSLGAFLSLNKMDITFKPKKINAILLLIFWIGFNLMSIYVEKYSFLDDTVIRAGNIFKDFLGCLAVWYLYDVFNRDYQWKNYSFYNYSFFIFAFHGIPALIFVRISSIICKGNPYYLFLAYLLIFISAVVISIFVGKSTNKLLPKVYKILTGSR
jgi:peptidoglycan/LPS O-acetylase OafA/YrhL